MTQDLDMTGAAKYQSIVCNGKVIKPGWRCVEPRKFIDWKAMKGKTVLDLGCNNGQNCIYAKEAGATRVVGVEFDESYEFARNVMQKYNIDVEIWRADLNSIEFLSSCPQFDIVLACAIYRYMVEKPRFLMFLEKVTREALWIETNHKMMAEPLFEDLNMQTSFVSKIMGYSGNAPDKPHIGHFMIRSLQNQQWRDWPTTMVQIELLKLSHDLEAYKTLPQYAPGTYEEMLGKVTVLADSIRKYGLKRPIWVRENLDGPDVGTFRVVEGHKRSFALKELRKEGRKFDVPVKVFPQVPHKFIRQYGLHPDDYTRIFEEERRMAATINS